MFLLQPTDTDEVYSTELSSTGGAEKENAITKPNHYHPCGQFSQTSMCMKNGKFLKHFLKPTRRRNGRDEIRLYVTSKRSYPENDGETAS